MSEEKDNSAAEAAARKAAEEAAKRAAEEAARKAAQERQDALVYSQSLTAFNKHEKKKD